MIKNQMKILKFPKKFPKNPEKFLLFAMKRFKVERVHYLIWLFIHFWYLVEDLFGFINFWKIRSKDTNRKIRKIKFIDICGSKNGSSSKNYK